MAKDAESGTNAVNNVRLCSLCRAKDYPLILPDYCNCNGGNDLADHATGCRSIQHFVTKDIKAYKKVIGSELPSSLQRQGWKDGGIFQGKEAIQRLLCRDCIRKQDEIDELKRHVRKVALEAEGQPNMNLYQILSA